MASSYGFNELMRQQAESMQNAMLGAGQAAGQGAAGVFYNGVASQSAQNQREYNAIVSQQIEREVLSSNPYRTTKRELTIKEELQAETDEWLKDICI